MKCELERKVMMSRPVVSKQGGFSLIEIMVVVVIMGILVSLVAPNVLNSVDDARIQKAQADFKAIETALNLYRLDNYTYPTSDQGLQALVSQPNSEPAAPNWKTGGYLPELPVDPWGSPYLYLSPGEHGQADVYTLGADRTPGGEGQNTDIGNWTEK
ncbi:MAG: type II secretion system major pseudopilin GspG [Pseudomonadales bacterium]